MAWAFLSCKAKTKGVGMFEPTELEVLESEKGEDAAVRNVVNGNGLVLVDS